MRHTWTSSRGGYKKTSVTDKLEAEQWGSDSLSFLKLSLVNMLDTNLVISFVFSRCFFIKTFNKIKIPLPLDCCFDIFPESSPQSCYNKKKRKYEPSFKVPPALTLRGLMSDVSSILTPSLKLKSNQLRVAD